MWQSLPEFGTGVLYAILVAAAYTFAVALAAGQGRPRLLQAARLGAYGTVALIGLGVLVLAYAFVSHDFRLSYVSRYSDRSMSTPYLIAALWGGQDGSLLWWLFLTGIFSAGCVIWLKRRYLELQPYVIATLMSILMFFAILMIFAANPFSTNVAGAPVDGSGLNYQLRNFYMIIHPPSLYIGFTSAAVPFAFAVAALATGRLDSEWIVATRKWMLFSWLFLSIGNVLGMLWAYEELGWGGPWAWDPVENAAFLPWLTASAYVHSTMIQERRGMLKVWNVFLICMTFFLTIFGTWLTRSGLIASVHSFAQSGIGIFFVYFMGLIIATCAALIVYRLPRLRSQGQFESVLSRETAFLLNNWGLFSLMVFIAAATVWPRISEWLLDQKSALGPTFYNAWIPPIALTVFLLMGIAPLLGWRKTSPELFRKSFRWPVAVMVLVAGAHLLLGRRVGFPAFVAVDPIYEGTLGRALAGMASTYPFFTIAFAAFNVTVVVQEFARGIAARQKRGGESVFASLFNLVAKSRRRYGGYIVHVGIAIMFVGFAGRAWGVDKEVTLKPGETVTIEEYKLSYQGTRMELDTEKRMLFADLDVERHGKPVGRISPAKFIYKAGDMPSSEVALHVTLRNDLYVVLGMANPQDKRASFQLHVNSLISFMWVGAVVLALGAIVAMWPEITFEEAGAFAYVRAAASVGTSLLFGLLLAGGPAMAYGGGTITERWGPRAEQMREAPWEAGSSAAGLPGAGDILPPAAAPAVHTSP
ncbi:heme lyase CcmF/NrfE family subunit [Chondromyces apiculatus]|uniref:Cytochrome c heme lyase subunit CcmF n=1 Tax=Chondromyces apiculatus DSM 436 TaxID=1192034 RepID=A0A017T4W0_9BACT|nr:cytochrome c-type biogenesis CcmF C-terminal domain-containing protein [Chondromyces apiculatus]EYF03576.1 Cytochrome c heme lyase subunit CcmF [Chondromyces apiculatus DSM 436]